MTERAISQDTYLRAVALFTMAATSYAESHRFRCALAVALDVGDPNNLGAIDDAIYGKGGELATLSDLHAALKIEGFAWKTQ